MLNIFGSRAHESGNTQVIAELAQSLTYIGTRIMLRAVLGTRIFDLWPVFENSDWNFGQLWVRLAIGLFILPFLIRAVYLGRIGMQLQSAALTDSANGEVLLGRWITGYWIVLALFSSSSGTGSSN